MFTHKMFYLGLLIVGLMAGGCATTIAPPPSPVASLNPPTALPTSLPTSTATVTSILAMPTLLPTLPSSPLPNSASDVTSTEVIQFTPAIPTGPAQSGRCWTNSLAAIRDDAWRCMMGNSIADPCFAVGETPTIVCDADPAVNKAGFVVNLTEPLPKSDIPARARQAYRGWLIRLVDGTLCSFATGATTVVNGERANYLCTDQSVILGDLKPGQVWTAQKAVVSVGANGPQLDKGPETVIIRTVWQ